jgi:hypothetical protein
VNGCNYLLTAFNSFTEEECMEAIKTLQQRIALLQDPHYYLKLRIDEIFIPINAVYPLQKAGLKTVQDVLEYGWENIALLKGIGPRFLAIVKGNIDVVVQKKDYIRGLTGPDLYLALITK